MTTEQASYDGQGHMTSWKKKARSSAKGFHTSGVWGRE